MATYYVDPVDGNDAWNGGYLDPWKTTTYAMTQVDANDILYLIKSGTEELAGTLNLPVDGLQLIGVDTNLNPLPRNQHYEYNCAGVGGTNPAVTQASSCVSFLSKIRFHSGPGIGLYPINPNSYIWMQSCRIDNFASHGVYSSNASSGIGGYDVEIDSNGGAGVTQSTTSRCDVRLSACRIHHNTGAGINSGVVSSYVINSLIYRNGGIGVKLSYSYYKDFTVCSNNTIYANGSHGVEGPCIIGRNSLVNNGGYGINGPSLTGVNANHYHNNTSGETSLGAGNTPGLDNVTGDPLFTSVVDGSEDFTPQEGSPLIRVSPLMHLVGAISPVAGSWSRFESMRVR